MADMRVRAEVGRHPLSCYEGEAARDAATSYKGNTEPQQLPGPPRLNELTPLKIHSWFMILIMQNNRMSLICNC